jgi:hypothetical protein
MAKKKTKKVEKAQYQCRHCTYSYDWHEIGADGKPFMCRCPYYTDGKYCRFLSDPQCEHFNLREGAVIATEAKTEEKQEVEPTEQIENDKEAE